MQQRRKTPEVPVFIEKLHKILENSDYLDIITWTNDNQSIHIKSISQFAEKVLPKYYNHKNYSSFIRQLNIYDFSKIRHQDGQNVYKHELFKKGVPYLLIQRRQNHRDIKRRNKNTMTIEQQQLSNQPIPQNYTSEMSKINQKHKDMENVCKRLFIENQNILKENSKLWKKIQKKLDKRDKKLEKLICLIFLGKKRIENHETNMIVLKNDEDDSSFDPLEQQESDSPQWKINSNIMKILETKNGIINLLKMILQKPKKNKKFSIGQEKERPALMPGVINPQTKFWNELEDLNLQQYISFEDLLKDNNEWQI